MSAIKSNNLVVPVAPLNITKDNGYSAETGAYGHFDFASRGFNTLAGSATLTPKDPNFLFKNGELRQVAKNDFTILSDLNDDTDISYAVVFKVYSSNNFNEYINLFGNSLYGQPNGALGGTFLGIKNSTGVNQLAMRTGAYDPNITLCDLATNTAYFAFVQRETSTKKMAFKVMRLTDDTVMHNTAPTAYNANPLPAGYYHGIGKNSYVSTSNTTDFGMSELLLWKSLQYANVDAIYQRAKARAKIKGYI